MEDIRITLQEQDLNKVEDENVGEFWFCIDFPYNRFKEIRQTRYTSKFLKNNKSIFSNSNKRGIYFWILKVSKYIIGL